MRAQRGFAVLAVAVVIVMIAAAVVVGWSTLTSVGQTHELERHQREYLADVKQQLTRWYERELAQIDALVGAPDPARAVREAGISPRWGLRIAISERVARGAIEHRVIAAWLPAEGDTSVLDGVTGVFAPSRNAQWVTVSGFDLQARALADTQARLARLARKLEAAYRMRYLSDPSRDVTVNRFRAARCASPGTTELPCLDTYLPIDGTPLGQLNGIEPQLTMNAWGLPIEVSNLIDSSQSIPYSMALRTVTPWGAAVSMIAVAPL